MTDVRECVNVNVNVQISCTGGHRQHAELEALTTSEVMTGEKRVLVLGLTGCAFLHLSTAAVYKSVERFGSRLNLFDSFRHFASLCLSPNFLQRRKVRNLASISELSCLSRTLIVQVAQLSQRDRAAGWVSNGQKWKTETERQYLRTI